MLLYKGNSAVVLNSLLSSLARWRSAAASLLIRWWAKEQRTSSGQAADKVAGEPARWKRLREKWSLQRNCLRVLCT